MKVNPVDFLKFRDFNNKYGYGVHAIGNIDEDLGHCPTTVQLLLLSLLGSEATDGATKTELVKALSSKDEVKDTEAHEIVPLGLQKWADLSVSGLGDALMSESICRKCRLNLCVFAEKGKPIKYKLAWLLKHKMDALWTNIEKDNENAISEWVKTISWGKIEDSMLNLDDQFLYLLSNLQVICKWKTKLQKFGSSINSFELTPSKKIDIPMLEINSPVVYIKDDVKGFHLVGIPFPDSQIVLVFMLPLTRHTFKEVEHGLTEGVDWSLFNNTKIKPVNMKVVFPKFHLSTTVDLVKALFFLGVSTPFNSKVADFSGVSESAGLHIGKSIETSYLKISRKGIRFCSIASLNLTTQSTAYTKPSLFTVPELEAAKTAAVSQAEFIVDQPFSLILFDKTSCSVLYSARVKQPRPTKS